MNYVELTENELNEINGGSATVIVTLLTFAFSAGYKFGTDLANGNLRRSGTNK